MKALGIDIGTTSICGILLDTQSGTIIKSITRNSEAFIETPNEWERIQDTEKIIRIATEITEELLTEEVSSIGVTGQMHGILYYDCDGKAISPLYTWQDGRGNQPCDGKTTYGEVLGLPSGYGNVTDFYNRKNGLRPENAVGFCTIHDYFVMTLTDRKIALIHTSDAASFGGFDLEKGEFSEDFYGEITGGFDIAGTYKGIPVSVAIGDNQASVFGALQNDSDILLNIGTGSQISVISDKVITGDNIEARPYMDGKYLIVGAALCGGRAYSMLEKFYSDIVFAATGERINMYGVMDKMGVPETPSPLCDSRFDGTRKDPSLKGSLCAITTENFTPAHIRYAFLQGIIGELYDDFCEMGVSHGALVGSGNAVRKNAALRKCAEEIFGAKMSVPSHMEEAAFGAALFALGAAGTLSLDDVKKIIKYQEK